MMKKIWRYVCVALIAGLMTTCCIAQEVTEKAVPEAMPEAVPDTAPVDRTISGVVDEVAQDGSYVVVSGNKIMIPMDMVEYFNIEKGDQVEVIVEEVNGVVQAVDYDYL